MGLQLGLPTLREFHRKVSGALLPARGPGAADAPAQFFPRDTLSKLSAFGEVCALVAAGQL